MCVISGEIHIFDQFSTQLDHYNQSWRFYSFYLQGVIDHRGGGGGGRGEFWGPIWGGGGGKGPLGEDIWEDIGVQGGAPTGSFRRTQGCKGALAGSHSGGRRGARGHLHGLIQGALFTHPIPEF